MKVNEVEPFVTPTRGVLDVRVTLAWPTPLPETFVAVTARAPPNVAGVRPEY